jgi:hypothetical protein
VVGVCNLFSLPYGKGRRVTDMSDNQFILQSAKIESKPDVGRKRIKAKGRKREEKNEKRRMLSNTNDLLAGCRGFP